MDQQEYYEEEDIFRILELDDMVGYVFKFSYRDDLLRMHDSNGDGEMAEDHVIYTDAHDEVCFLFSSYETPCWPVIAEF